MYSPGDNTIRAQLGFLEEDEASISAEVALVLCFKEGQLNTDSFLLGGKASSQVVPLEKLEGVCKNVDFRESVTVAVDLSAILFDLGRKATSWKKLEIMFKESLSGSVDFSKEVCVCKVEIVRVKA